MNRFQRLSVATFFLLLFPMIASAQSKYADVSAALNVSALQLGKDAIVAVVLDAHDGYHAQSHTPHDPNLIPCTLKADDNPSLTFGDPIFPPGKEETYPALGNLSVYTGRTILYLPVKVNAGASPGDITISGVVRYQACNDQSCFAPQKPPFKIEAKIVGPTEAVSPANAELFKDYSAAKSSSNDSPTTAAAMAQADVTAPPGVGSDKPQWSFGGALGVAFLAGLLFNIMPCVLPVLPLKAIGFYEVSQHHRSKSLALGFVFSAGLVSVFAVLAVLVLVLKTITWGGLFSQGWFVWTIVTVLVVLAFGLLGGWNFRLPMGAYTFEPRHDTYSGNFFWGALTAVLATPCTAPLLPPLLLWATTQPTWVGVCAMLNVGVGMASPYLLLSGFPELARRFPRTGPWSELFKQMMGFMLLAAAMFFAGGRIVEGGGYWWLVTAVVAIACLFMLARSVQLTKNAMPVAITATLAVILLGGTIYWSAKVTGLFTSAAGSAVEQSWIPYSDDQFHQARDSGKIVLVKFTANWCASCQYIEGTVFRDPSVWDYLKKNEVIALKADFTSDNPPADALLKTLNPTGGIPLTAIYAPGAKEPIQLSSVYTSDTLLKAMQSLPRKSVAVAQ